MPKIDGRNAVMPFAPHSSTGAAPQEGKAEPARRAPPDASLQALAKRPKPSVEAATGKTETPAAPPRAALPKAKFAGRAGGAGDAHGAAGAAPPPAHEHAGTPPEMPQHSHAAEQAEHPAGHAAHAPDHDAQVAAAKTHHERLQRFSDFRRRLAEHKSNVLVKLVGG